MHDKYGCENDTLAFSYIRLSFVADSFHIIWIYWLPVSIFSGYICL